MTTPEERFIAGLRAALAEYDEAAAKEAPPGHVPDPAFQRYLDGLRAIVRAYDAGIADRRRDEGDK